MTTENNAANSTIEGVFTAKIINYGVSLTKNNEPQVVVNFRVNETTTKTKDMIWFGTLKEGRGKEITIDALIAMGFTDNNLDRVAGGEGLNKEKEVQVTIEAEADDKGKMVSRIKWVNAVGGGYMNKLLTKEDAIKRLRTMNLEASIMERKMNAGILNKPAGQTQTPEPTEEIPF